MIKESYISENVDYLDYVTLHFKNALTICNSEMQILSMDKFWPFKPI